MKKWIIFGWVCLLLLCTQGLPAQRARYVVLITVDGMRPEFYLDPSWGMVNLHLMHKEGAHAKGAHSVFPSATLPAHTSIVTGVSPARHGIYYNSPFRPLRESDEWYWYYEAIQTPTLWEVLREAGMRTASVNWPVTVGAPIDFNVPVFKAAGKPQLEVTYPHCTPAGLLEEIEREATGRLTNTDFSMQGDLIVQDQTMARIAAWVIRTHKPNFITVHLSAVDHFEHEEGRDGPMVRRAVSGADREIRTIVESIQRAGILDSTTIIITGDHGHVDVHTSIAPNIWLWQGGLLGDLAAGDWKAQFKTSGGSAFLHLRDPEDEVTLQRVKELLSGLPRKERKLFQVIEGDALQAAGADPGAVLALTAAKGTAFNAALSGEVYKRASGATHGHLPGFREIRTGFVASGAGIRKGAALQEIRLVDIAPTVASLLGLSLPGTEGRLIEGLLE